MERLFLANMFLLMLSVSVLGAQQMKPGAWIPVSSATKVNGPQNYGTIIGSCHEGGWVEFGPFEFSDGFVDRVEMRLAAPGASGSVSLRYDSPQGSAVASVEIQDTGGFNEFAVLAGDSEQLAGTHKLYMTFEGGKNLCNVKEFRFLKPGQKGSANAKVMKKQSLPSGVSAIIDNALSSNNDDILKNRTVLVQFQTAPNASVQVKQARHAFEFGTAINRRGFLPDTNITKADQEKYKEIILQNFNSVVHENAMKWYSNEREKGKLNFEAADAMLEWSEQNGLYTRGHCVFWGRDKLVQGWIKELDDAALRQKLQERAKVYMERYKGRVLEHDINNEMVHCTYYKDRLGAGIWKQMFDWCHQYDPEAILYVNDYSILSGGDTDKYIKQISGFIKDGMKVGGIGVQGHFGGRVNSADVKKKLDQLAQFGLPIKVTEYDANTKDEAAKANALAALYATAFAHPSVDGIYMWGFWERSHWRPNAALWDADWKENLAAKCYRELVFSRWWTDETSITDDRGHCTVRMFYGDHDITVNGKKRRFKINEGSDPIVIDCRSADPKQWRLK